MILKIIIIVSILFFVVVVIYIFSTYCNLNVNTQRGTVVDSLNSVYVYYNGGVNQTSGRNVVDGYNIGMKYQCVEFVKRYYYEYYHHKMPDSYGHAKSFFDKKLSNGEMNVSRGLIQYKNGEGILPQIGDIVVFDGYLFNPYGHVAIISAVGTNEVELIQQNSGCMNVSRKCLGLTKNNSGWEIQNKRILGWLHIAE
ncbi:CHAP domain protein [Bacteroides fragilis str. 3986 N(B)22]|nr:CHAP domain protein [Bacteroides fragilis str. 3986 N(B)22]